MIRTGDASLSDSQANGREPHVFSGCASLRTRHGHDFRRVPEPSRNRRFLAPADRHPEVVLQQSVPLLPVLDDLDDCFARHPVCAMHTHAVLAHGVRGALQRTEYHAAAEIRVNVQVVQIG